MEFLPIKLNGEKVYAGFWNRFCAGILDTLILIPFIMLFKWLEGLDRNLAIFITIPSTIFFALYNLYFNAKFGGTIGKLAVKILITKPNGMFIGWSEALKRSLVDIVFAFIILITEI